MCLHIYLDTFTVSTTKWRCDFKRSSLRFCFGHKKKSKPLQYKHTHRGFRKYNEWPIHKVLLTARQNPLWVCQVAVSTFAEAQTAKLNQCSLCRTRIFEKRKRRTNITNWFAPRRRQAWYVTNYCLIELQYFAFEMFKNLRGWMMNTANSATISLPAHQCCVCVCVCVCTYIYIYIYIFWIRKSNNTVLHIHINPKLGKWTRLR